MTAHNKSNKSKGLAGLLVVVPVVIVSALAVFFYALSTGVVNIPSLNLKLFGTLADQDKVVKVSFSYKVKSIASDELVLTGNRGDFTLPYDSLRVTVYKGASIKSPKMELNQLKVGDTVNMEFIPGKSATLFVSTI